MPTYVETRGSGTLDDYKFLGAGPAHAWWYQGYGEQTTFDHPTVLVERDEHGWRLYVGAIPSSRHDPTGSTNRFAVVAESDADEVDRDRDGLVRLVGSWLADVAEEREPGRVRDALDEAFTPDLVDRLYADDGPVADVRSRLRTACGRLGEPDAAAVDLPGSWIAPLRGTPGRAAFVARVRALLDGRARGSAIFVNLVDRADAFVRDPGDPPLAVLVTDPERVLPPEPRPLAAPPTAKKAPGPTTPSGRGRTWTLVALALLLVVGLVWWMTEATGLTGPTGMTTTSTTR